MSFHYNYHCRAPLRQAMHWAFMFGLSFHRWCSEKIHFVVSQIPLSACPTFNWGAERTETFLATQQRSYGIRLGDSTLWMWTQISQSLGGKEASNMKTIRDSGRSDLKALNKIIEYHFFSTFIRICMTCGESSLTADCVDRRPKRTHPDSPCSARIVLSPYCRNDDVFFLLLANANAWQPDNLRPLAFNIDSDYLRIKNAKNIF